MLAAFMRSHGWDAQGQNVPENLAGLIQTDSRKVEKGQWFVPIIGEHHDGHDYIERVDGMGAAGFLYQRSSKKISPALKARGIAVDDTTRALQDLAQWWRAQHPGCQVIGITGSSGKTSVKELCAEMLSSIAPTLKTVGSLNNELGVPLTLLQLTDSHKFAVIEMGARHRGDIAFLTAIVAQNVGVLINVGSAHIGEFGGHEQVLAAKMEIAAAPAAVYFRDDERIHTAMQGQRDRKERLSFGRHPEADVRILEDRCDSQGQLQLRLTIKGEPLALVLPYFHEVYALNVATVLAIAQSLQLPIAASLEGLKKYTGIKGRFQVHRLPAYTLIDDAYNANPQSMRAGLETLLKAFPASKKVLILGDMRELGDETEQAHRQIGEYCAREIKPELLITVGESSQWLEAAALAHGLSPERVLHYKDVEAVLPQLKEIGRRGDLLYVKASNGLKLFKIIDTLLTA